MRGLAGIRSPFKRTVKGTSPANRGGSGLERYAIEMTPATFLEGGLALYFLLALYLAFHLGNFWFVPFHLLCFASCGFVFAVSMVELW